MQRRANSKLELTMLPRIIKNRFTSEHLLFRIWSGLNKLLLSCNPSLGAKLNFGKNKSKKKIQFLKYLCKLDSQLILLLLNKTIS